MEIHPSLAFSHNTNIDDFYRSRYQGTYSINVVPTAISVASPKQLLLPTLALSLAGK